MSLRTLSQEDWKLSHKKQRLAKKVTISLTIISIIVAALIFVTRATLMVLAYAITLLYLAWGIYHVIVTIAGIKPLLNPQTPPKFFPKLSAIIPAMNEPILPRTVQVLVEHVDYPLAGKEVVIVTDDPMGERMASLLQHKYRGVVKAVARREFFPTKPSALNDGFALSTGEVVCIVDVEDVPDSDAFIKAVSALVNHGYDAVQLVLRINNEDDSWITRIFALEYAGWFRVWLNGRSRLGLFTPLGGTGNYFWRKAAVQVGGWDSLNVAEDAELAVRMTLSGMKIKVVDARHWEEAPANFRAWLRQRTRWYRGWLQSLWKYLLLLFRPRLLRRAGPLTIISTLLMLCSPLVVLLNWASFALTGLWILEYYGITPPLLYGIFPSWALAPLLMNAIYFGAWFLGGRYEGVKTKWWRILPHMLFYFYVMLPLASLRALWQQMFRPVFWEKTTHPGRGVNGFIIESEQSQIQMEETSSMASAKVGFGGIRPELALLFWSMVLALDLLFIATLLANPAIL
jgi:cellulose synthase/poly-beta-1,6-N-acetylglucosamine synthase-like glycosyltransferase